MERPFHITLQDLLDAELMHREYDELQDRKAEGNY